MAGPHTRKGSFCFRLCILWVGGQIGAKTASKIQCSSPHMGFTVLLPTLRRGWWQHWWRREDHILRGRAPFMMDPRRSQWRRAAKKKVVRRHRVSSNNRILFPSSAPGKASGSSHHLRRMFQSLKGRGIQQQSNGQSCDWIVVGIINYCAVGPLTACFGQFCLFIVSLLVLALLSCLTAWGNYEWGKQIWYVILLYVDICW